MNEIVIDTAALFDRLNDGKEIPRILGLIQEAGGPNFRVEIRRLPEEKKAENYLVGGSYRLERPNPKGIITINDDFVFSSILAHELLHILFGLNGFPMIYNREDEFRLAKLYILIASVVNDIIFHKNINDYLIDKPLDSGGSENLYLSRLANAPRPSVVGNSLGDLLYSLYLVNAVNDHPNYEETIIEEFGRWSPQIVSIYEYTKIFFDIPRRDYCTYHRAYRLLLHILKNVNDLKRGLLGAEDYDLQLFVGYFPIYFPEEYKNLPASDYFSFVLLENLNKIKLVYELDRESGEKIHIVTINEVANEIIGTYTRMSAELIGKSVDEFFEDLFSEGILRRGDIRFVNRDRFLGTFD